MNFAWNRLRSGYSSDNAFLAEGSWKQARDLGALMGHLLTELCNWTVSCGAVDSLSDAEILTEAERVVAWLEM